MRPPHIVSSHQERERMYTNTSSSVGEMGERRMRVETKRTESENRMRKRTKKRELKINGEARSGTVQGCPGPGQKKGRERERNRTGRG